MGVMGLVASLGFAACSGDDDAASNTTGGKSTSGAGANAGGKTSNTGGNTNTGGKTNTGGNTNTGGKTNTAGTAMTNAGESSGGSSMGGAPAMMSAGAGGETYAEAGAGGAETASTDVQLHDNAKGNIFTDSRGFALYVHKGDTASASTPVSTCTAGCIAAWPPFSVTDPSVPSDLSAADFRQYTRPDGKTQSTYKGWPLYFFGGDATPGTANGDGLAGVWFVAKFPFTAPN
jgi:predicted lipoprotein with Yx(FWY)xxD motif